MKKLSFEKFASAKMVSNKLSNIAGGTATAGGSCTLENYMGGGHTFCMSWSSDEVGAGGGVTYQGEKSHIC
jgi:hypothetical protein